MPELRRDPITGRWVIVNKEAPFTPKDFEVVHDEFKGEENCPFCYGHEHMTPPEIEAIRPEGGAPNSPGWKVRVVPNKFPALKIEGELDKRGEGVYDKSRGIGAHEVIIDSPHHYKGLSELEEEEIQFVIDMYLFRSLDLRKDRRFRYILIFKNFGSIAGSSLEHGHSQLIALPMVPKNVREELKGAARYIGYHERCIFCDIISQERGSGERIIFQNRYFIAFCPLFGRFPFEVWIIPVNHNCDFGFMPQEEKPYLASILKQTMGRIKEVLDNPPYNYIIHTCPVNIIEMPGGYHWHIEIMPKLNRVAGFEWGSGFYVVQTPPELAAKYLRKELSV